MKTHGITVIIAFVITLLVIGAYHFTAGRSPTQIASIDIADIMAAIQDKYVKKLVDEKTSEADRKKATADMEAIGTKIQPTIAEIERECNCVLLIKQVVVTDNIRNMTAAVKQKLGL